MKILPLALGLALTAVPAVAQAAPAAKTAPKPMVVTVNMVDRGFHPQVIRLKAGRLTTLRFINRDGTTHDVTASAFYAHSRIPRSEGWKLRGGRLDVPPHSMRTLTLTPMVPAPYDAKSSKLLDVASNMTAQILVY